MSNLLERLRQAPADESAVKEAYDLATRAARSLLARRPAEAVAELGIEPEDLAARLFDASPGQPNRLAQLVLTSGSLNDFRRKLNSTIKRLLIDRENTHGRHALHNRLKDVLDSGPFERAGGQWSIAGSGFVTAATTPPSVLVEAAYSVDVSIHRPDFRQTPDRRRSTSYASRADLVSALTAVLSAADGTLDIGVLCEVMTARLQLGAPQDRYRELAANSPAPDPETIAAAREIVRQIWDGLTVAQRQVLAFLEYEARDAAVELDRSSSAAHELQQRARATIAEHLKDCSPDLQLAVAHELLLLISAAHSPGQDNTMGRKGK
jgi:hypothetical protein